ncbi:BREX-1 system adenine-specific DNA-methyltransferase PglX [uncultured Holdemanella sp.]|uniref:BREX-1 system adenine-specific DNA-methyltransferase PglX n=1 Tax=uncultured Holdemanella sp. TaxID=1763549 RepID=UPI00265821B9|nr:BREX-1 system adenine-specific DNA-methyltransferase PglX [uncultured Holdemanella sp.]
MNKNAIKNYAVWARTELMKQVAQKAYEYDVTESSLPGYNTDNVNGRLLTGDEKKQLNELITEVKKNGYEHVIEEVAYTWFNRFIALRYMEVNNYLPQRIRVFTNDNNEFKPDLLTDAIHVELDGLDKQKVFDYIEENKQEELYKYLLLTLCNDMNQYLPDMFTSIKDYKTLLFPDNLLKEDSVLAKLITDIDEDSWTDQVQIIGWLYQYYNSELKDIVMKKKNYTKDDIPAATQLFTPDWIVRYMTENSLGRLWLDGHPDFDHSEWKYYLEEAKQEPEVIEQLNKIKEEHAKLKPEDIKVIDPCMGSGHILVYAFDVLMDIYRDAGFSDRDAAKSILENNLYGLEIDERAYHLAYFALMMKARSYNRRILNKKTKFNLIEIREPIAPLKPEFEQYLDKYTDLAHYLVNVFQDAKEFGSILNLDCTVEQLNNLKSHLDELKEEAINKDLVVQSEVDELNDLLKPLIKQAKLLVQKYDVVITNPPYMAPDAKQKSYVQKNYPDSKSDFFAIFIEKCHSLTKKNAYQAMITMHSWMFLSSFEKLRNKLLINNTIINMAHLGARAFEDIGGEVVQTTAFVFDNVNIKGYQSNFKRLVDYNSQDAKEEEYLKDENLYTSSATNFSKIPGSPIAYWVSEKTISWCEKHKLSNDVVGSVGIQTGDNEKFIRLWQEVNFFSVKFDAKQAVDTYCSQKWYPYNKGGDFRKWYGNDFYVVYWQNDGAFLKNDNKITGHHYQEYKDNLKFAPLVTWSRVTSGQPSFRIKENGFLSDMAGFSIFSNTLDLFKIIAFCNSKVANHYLQFIAPTLNIMIGNVLSLPFDSRINCNDKVRDIVSSCMAFSKSDWDSFETSWDFKVHPLVKNHVSTINEAYNLWNDECESRFNTLKSNEEELNRIFNDIYGLQDELDPYVDDKDVTVRKADLVRDIKSFISYAVGCIFGRYSLDVEGLAYAGGEWDSSKYSTFTPDTDDIIPICDEEYFEDDIVSRFVEFVRVVYGSDTLEDNLSFIANALGGKGASRDVLRNYFLNDFFKDHCNTYQVTGSGKRPIYWLFDSGKKNGFKALVYIHRYAPDLIARMRTGYIHPQQARYRTQVELLQSQIDDASSTSERVKLSKQLKKINEQLLELNKYEEVVHHWADKMEPMDLDDGVKANYAKFQELLAKIK